MKFPPRTRRQGLIPPIDRYMDPFVSNLKRFINMFGDDGKQELNTVCAKHQLVFAPQEATSFNYGGLEVKDGVLRLVFHEKHLGTNTSDVSLEFAKALKDAPPVAGASAFNIDARNSVRDKYDPEVEGLRSTIAGLVNMPSLKLNPNFEHNAKALANSKDQNSSWDKQIGQATLDYFRSVKSNLERNQFKDDEMLQEGFQEVITKGEICFRIVDKLNKGTYNELLVEDGVLYVQVSHLPCPKSPTIVLGLVFDLTVHGADCAEILVDQCGRRSQHFDGFTVRESIRIRGGKDTRAVVLGPRLYGRRAKRNVSRT